LTIGNFDGVHRGHQQIIAQAGMFAAQTGAQVVVITFDPHPLSIVSPEQAPARLMPLEERIRCLGQAGADVVIVLKSDPELLSLEPEDFVEQAIVDKFSPTHIVEGRSFGFGKGRRGNPDLLKQLSPQLGFEFFVVEPVKLQVENCQSVRVSSSLIRELVSEGKVNRAFLCLGRPYALLGVVEHGQLRGRELGYPTANLGHVAQLLPAQGVYAGAARLNEEVSTAAISIGTTPTFGGQQVQIEAFLLDFDRDLYDQPLQLEFWHYLRNQQRFSSVAKLKQQIDSDVKEIRQLASEQGLP